MQKSIYKTNIITIVLFVLMALYEHDEMKNEAFYELAQTASYSRFLALGMFVIFAIYTFSNGDKRTTKTNKFYNSFKLTVLSISIVAYFWALFSNGLPSLPIYFLLILPIFLIESSYTLVKQSPDTKLFFTLVSLLMVLLLFDYVRFRAVALFMMGKEEGLINISYYSLYLLPLVLCVDKKNIRVIGLILVFAAVVSSGKRGGTIALFLASFVYLIIKVFGKRERNKFLRLLFFFAIVAVVGHYAVGKLANSDLIIISRFEDIGEGGSGRTEIWADVVKMIFNSSPLQLILGHGYGAVTAHSSAKMVAHNDFLELMYDYGFIVVIIYMTLHINVIKKTIRMIKENSFYAAPMAFSYAIFLVNSMVSHIFIYPKYIMLYALVWGAMLALYEKEKTQRYYSSTNN